MERNKKTYSNKVGFLSRIDFGAEGFRKGLLDWAKKIFEKHDVGFIVLAGGLISQRALKGRIPKKSRKKNKKEGVDTYQKEHHRFIQSLAKELSSCLPKVKRQNSDIVDWYIVTSPAYDGVLGENVAQELAHIRDDTRTCHPGNDRLKVKGLDKIIWAATPEKAVWMRGDYYSTPVQRVIKDLQKRSSSALPDLYAVGCFGSNINKPQGEELRPYISIPVLSKLYETTVAENQIGIQVVEFMESEYKVHSYSAKGLLHDDRKFVVAPKGVSRLGRKIINKIRKEGALSVGLLEDGLDVARKKIKNEIDSLPQQNKSWPGIHYNESTHKYDFNLDWIQKNVKYHLRKATKSNPIKKDNIIAFSCLHAGCVHTDYATFLRELPKYILREDVDVLVNAGDSIEGREHNLPESNELYSGANYTNQEEFAAHLIGKVMMDVFQERFKKEVQKYKGKKLPLEDVLRKCLLLFVYILGNHDDWEKKKGFTPLKVFWHELREHVREEIYNVINECGYDLKFKILNSIIKEKIVLSDKFSLPSGLTVEIFHPYMARAKTQSIRAQEALRKSDAHIVISGNFHVAVYVQEYSPELGERQSLVAGTIKHRSDFEDHKLKTVDFGVGLLQVKSQNGKIISATNALLGKSDKKSLSNNDPFKMLYKKLGLKKEWT